MSVALPLPGGGRLRAAIHACGGCTHRFLPTSPGQQLQIEGAYGHDYSGFRVDPFFSRRIREEVARTLIPRMPAPARVLDVGCGSGEFMHAAAEAGYDVEGIDVSEAAAEFCLRRGLRARAGDFLAVGGEYDMVTMWDVVEHLREPETFIRQAGAVLAPGGVLVLKIPGFGGLNFPAIAAWNRLGRTILHAPNHVQFFTPRSLDALLHRCGFTRVEPLGSGRFRSRPPTRSVRRRAARLVARAMNRLAGNHNLYLAAWK